MRFSESKTMEIKSTWHDSNLKTVSAFANSEGGFLVIGLDDSGKPVGNLKIKKLLEDIPNKINSKCGVLPKVYSKIILKKEILVVEINKSEAPISYNGHFFTRVGSTTQVMDGKYLSQFLIERSSSTWDEYITPEATKKDINLNTIAKFKENAKERLPHVKEDLELLLFLEKLNLADKKKLKRAAILLFGKNPKHFFTNAFLRIGKFDKDGLLVSSDTIEGNLFEQIEKAIDLLKVKYLISSTKIEGLYRKEVLDIPEDALREAIINALIHRNYVGAHTQIKIYPDKFSIWNEGGLPYPLKPTDLRDNHPSKPRNDLLADVFFKAGLIETWGQGTIKIIESCKSHTLPEPHFKEEFGGFSVTFFTDIFTEDHLNKLSLNDRQKKSVLHLKENLSISNSKYQELFSISKATATLELTLLVKLRILKREGTRGAGTIYKLNI
ncbi:MAG: putative DNA binding domain-containing protein [Candidatus Margulisbacteria bacterium]|nr:putative DNA binding domain-containing protein [Candidatus Margulisiibacteriota bacterium]